MIFPSCRFTSKNYKASFDSVKSSCVLDARLWQEELTEFCSHAGRYIQVHAPGGCGKTTWAPYNSIVESIHTDNSRKFLFLAPMTTICDSYARPLYFNYKGQSKEWNVLYRYGADPGFESIKNIKKFLLLKARSKGPILSAAATHQGWVHFWGDLEKEDKKSLLENLTIYIDECHHCSAEKTKLGAFLKDVLDINNSTCKVILMTATMFRGDEEEIIPKKYQKKFRPWLLQFEEYMELLQIKDFNFDYVLYDNDPLDIIVDIIKKNRDKKHIIILPDTGQHFRNDDTACKYMDRLITSFNPDRILDLVTKEKQRENKECLKNYPEGYDIILACKLFVEGTDWPPATILHNTRFGSSILMAAQISFRLFRRYPGKHEIWNYIYRMKSDFNKGIRIVFADRLNMLLLQILMAGHLQPIKISLLPKSPLLRATGRKNITVLGLLDKKRFDIFIGQIIAAHDLEVHEMTPARLIRNRFNKLAEDFYKKEKLKKHVSLKDFKDLTLKVVFRINTIARGQKENLDKLDISFIREEGNFDKVWEKADMLGSFVMGTKEPINKKDMEILREIYDQHMEQRLQASEVMFDWALERYIANKNERHLQLDATVSKTIPKPLKDMVGKWIKFSAPKSWKPNGQWQEMSSEQYGLVIAQSDIEVVVNFYKGIIRIDNEKHILLSTVNRSGPAIHVFCGNYWRPDIVFMPPYGVSAKLAKLFFFENKTDLYGGRRLVPKLETTIPIEWIVKTLEHKGGDL